MKVKIIFILICLVLFLGLDLVAEKTAVLSELTNPDSIRVGSGRLYVQERTAIYIYDPETFQLIGKFGKEGEGPGELKVNPFGAPMIMTPHQNRVYVSSLGKLSVFSKTGTLIREHKVHSMDSFIPLGDGYICFSTAPREKNSQEMVLAFFLADQDLKKQKLLYQTDFRINQNSDIEFPFTPFEPFVDGDRFYVVDGINGFVIKVFDTSGKMVRRIQKQYPELKILPSYRKETLEWFKTNPKYRQLYEMLKDRIKFKKYYPPLYSIQVDRGKIYAITNILKKDLRECLVLDSEGREIKQAHLPIPEQYGMDFKMLFTFKDGLFYRLAENPETEDWELFRIEI